MISIVIPVYNEEENVIPLYKSIKETMLPLNTDFEVLFVDDGSTDNTLPNLKKILSNGEGGGFLRVIELQRNFGQTPALLAGFENIRGDIVVTLDGDMQNDPFDIPKMISSLNDEYDVVCGWRKNRHDNIMKKFPSKINNFLNKKLNNVTIHDSGCTLRAYKRETIDDLQLFAEGHRYIPAILANKGYKLTEVETNHLPRIKGKTKYGFRRLFRGFLDLLTLGLLNKWGTKPMHLFSRWFLASSILGTLAVIWMFLERFLFYHIWDYYLGPVSILSNPLLIVSLLLFGFGIQSLFIGFIAELYVRNSSTVKNSYQIKKEWN
ncbi:MAG: glycosyltransferase family 2 protein [Candidatus Thorarchaeota archaeon]